MVVLRRPQEADRSISGALNDQSYQSRERATKSRGFPKAAGSSFAGAFARRAQTAAHLQKRDTADDYGRGRSLGDSRNGRAGLSADSKDFMKPCQLPLAVAAYLSNSASPFLNRATKAARLSGRTDTIPAQLCASPIIEQEYDLQDDIGSPSALDSALDPPVMKKVEPEQKPALMLYGSLEEAERPVDCFNQVLAASSEEYTSLSHIRSISCDGCRIYMTTTRGRVEQWFLQHGQLVHCPEFQFHSAELSSKKVLADGELIQSVHPCGNVTYLLTDEGRVLKVGTASYESTPEHGCSWQAMLSDVTPASKTGQQMTVSSVASSAYAKHGWVVLDKDSTMAELDGTGGRLARTAPQTKAARVCVSHGSTMVVCRRGEVYTIGGTAGFKKPRLLNQPSSPGPMAVRMGDLKVVQVACALESTALLTAEGAVFVYGSGSFTGLGGVSVIREPTHLSCLWGKPVKSIACGTAHTAVLTRDGQMFSWGKAQGARGQDLLTPKILGHVDSPVLSMACGPSCTIALRSFEVDQLPVPEMLTAAPTKFVKMMNSSKLIDSIELAASKLRRATDHTDEVIRGSESGSYSQMVKKHKQDHLARKHTGAYGILPPLAQQLKDKKSLVELGPKCTRRWDTMSAKGCLDSRMSLGGHRRPSMQRI